jgi:hypothetical protein
VSGQNCSKVKEVLLACVITLLATSIAQADNCSGLTDCYRTAQTGLAALVGVSALFGILISLGLDFMPVIGTVKGIYEASTGRDSITGSELAWWERVLGIVPLAGPIAAFAGTVRTMDRVTDASRAANAADAAGGVGRTADAVDMFHDTDRALDLSSGARYAGQVTDAVPVGEQTADAVDSAVDIHRSVGVSDNTRNATRTAYTVRDIDRANRNANPVHYLEQGFDNFSEGVVSAASSTTSQLYGTSQRLVRGNLGERLATDALAADGHQILSFKPSIEGTNQRGFDMITMHNGVVNFVDNKALTRSGNINSVSSLTTSFERNLSDTIMQLETLSVDASRSMAERQVFQDALAAIREGRYERIVTNANVARINETPTGLSNKLSDIGIKFIDVFENYR